MSNLICAASCGNAINPPSSYQDPCLPKTRKKYGFPYYALIRNDQVIADPSDIVLGWTPLKGTELQISPCGKIDLGSPSFTTSTDDSACGDTEVLETIYTPTFSTYWVDDTSLTHATYFQDLVDKYKCQSVIMFDCDGNPYLPREYRDFIVNAGPAPTGSPGFDFGLLQVPHPTQGDGNFEKWQVQLEIKLNGEEILVPTPLDGLLTALLA